MKRQMILGAVLAFFCVPLARAQYDWHLPDNAGPYFRAGVGPTIYQDGKLRQFSTPAFSGAQNEPVHYNVGAAVDGAAGYAFDKYFGMDFETGCLWARINNVSGYDSKGSTIANVPLLVNGTLSLPIRHTNLVPYIGGGAGGAVSVFDGHAFSDAAQTATAHGNQSDAVFAYQGFAGMKFMVGPNVALGVDYKYFATGNPAFGYSHNLNVAFDGVQTHTVLLTLEFLF